MRLALLIAMALLSGALAAQASIPVTGSISGTDSRMLLVSINFGATGQSVQLDLSIGATGGTSGLAVLLFDLEETAANGSATGVAGDFDPGMTVLNVSLTTGTYSGVVDFLVGVTTDSGTGTSPYTGTLSCTTLAAGAIVATASQIMPQPNFSNEFAYGRLLAGNRTTTAQVAYEFNVNYGPAAHPITYFLQGIGDVGGTITVSELDAGGNPITNLTVTDTAGFVLENNGGTTARTGVVRFRITVTPMANGTFDWTLIFPDSVTISPLGGGGGGDGGGDEEGCSTGESSGIGLLALLALLAVARCGTGALARVRWCTTTGEGARATS